MQKSLLFISAFVFLSVYVSYAEDFGLDCDKKDYTCYERYVNEICLSPYPAGNGGKNTWTTQGNDLGALKPQCRYEALTKNGIDTMISCMEGDERDNTRSLQDGINLSSIGSFEGFRAVEAARLLYKKRMNSIFACGIIASRSEKLDALMKNSKMKNGSSEIQNKLRNEQKRYENLKTTTECANNKSETNANEAVGMMSRSAMKEYCKFTFYLDYLEENTSTNITATENTDARIGNAPPKATSTTSDELLSKLRSNQSSIQAEREKAKRILPKAIRIYREMDRTYIVHIMLTLIYDDYIGLRDRLAKYLVITGQTFEKAFNAMDARQR